MIAKTEVMARYGYDATKCNELKRKRKNLYNKRYRRREKQKGFKPSDKNTSIIGRDIDSINRQIDALNSQIWKCSEEYFNIKVEERRIRDKIRYRKREIEKKGKGKRATQFRNEIKELNSQLEEKEERAFMGSPPYQNLTINKRKIRDRINYLAKKLRSGKIKKDGKLVDMTDSDRLKIVDKMKELGDQRKMLEELTTGKVLESVSDDYERVAFRGDAVRGLEEYEGTIYNYRSILDDVFRRRKIKEVIIGGDSVDGYQTLSWPKDRLAFEFQMSDIESVLGKDASEVTVIILLETKSGTLNVMYYNIAEIIEEDRQPFTKPNL